MGQRETDHLLVQRGLDHIATIPERMHAFREMGLSSWLVARATNTSPSTIRNWLSDQSRPHPSAVDTIDVMRTSLRILVDGGMPYERAVEVMRSREQVVKEGVSVAGDRPIDIARHEPDRAITMAKSAIADYQSRQSS
jgi:hypothetical protein